MLTVCENTLTDNNKAKALQIRAKLLYFSAHATLLTPHLVKQYSVTCTMPTPCLPAGGGGGGGCISTPANHHSSGFIHFDSCWLLTAVRRNHSSFCCDGDTLKDELLFHQLYLSRVQSTGLIRTYAPKKAGRPWTYTRPLQGVGMATPYTPCKGALATPPKRDSIPLCIIRVETDEMFWPRTMVTADSSCFQTPIILPFLQRAITPRVKDTVYMGVFVTITLWGPDVWQSNVL